MKKSRFLMLAIGMALLATACNPSQPEKTMREGDPGPELSALSLAIENARMGYELQQPLLLMSAANLLIETPPSELQLIATEEETITDETTKPSAFSNLNAANLLEDALLFAQGNNSLSQSISEMMEQSLASPRGAVGGPYTILRQVAKYSTNTYTMSFRAGELAEVAAIGDGDTDLDLYVFDSNGNLIGSDTDYTDKCYVSWIPKWTGEYKVLVKNLGSVYNEFMLATN